MKINARNIEELSLKTAAIIFVGLYPITFIVSYYLRQNQYVLDNKYVGLLMIGLSFSTAFVITFWSNKKKERGEGFLPALLLSVAYGIVYGIVALALALLLNAVFEGYTYAPSTAALWPCLLAAGITYHLVNKIMKYSIWDAANLMAIFLGGGVILSAVLNPNPEWWLSSVSSLGMEKFIWNKIFNIALFLSGLILLLLNSYFYEILIKLKSKKLTDEKSIKRLRAAFIISAFAMTFVGIFPIGRNPYFDKIHDWSAYVMFGGLLFIIASIKWSLPFLSKEFKIFNYTILAFAIFSYGLFVVGNISLAIFEVLGFGLVGVWFAIFLRNMIVAADS